MALNWSWAGRKKTLDGRIRRVIGCHEWISDVGCRGGNGILAIGRSDELSKYRFHVTY
jgi:hypothetical protein